MENQVKHDARHLHVGDWFQSDPKSHFIFIDNQAKQISGHLYMGDWFQADQK